MIRLTVAVSTAIGMACLLAEAAELPKQLAPDACVVDVVAPPEADISVDGVGYGKQRQFKWDKLDPSAPMVVQFAATLPDGRDATRLVVVRGGWSVPVHLSPIAADLPVPVIQGGHSDRVTALALSDDGTLLLTGSEDTTVMLWETATGRTSRTFRGHLDDVDHVEFSADSKTFLSSHRGRGISSPDPSIRIWSVSDGKQLEQFDLSGMFFLPVSPTISELLSQGRLFASYGDARVTWDVRSHDAVRLPVTDEGKGATVLAISDDGKTIVAVKGGDVTLREAATDRVLQKFAVDRVPWECSFARNGTRLLMTGRWTPEQQAVIDAPQFSGALPESSYGVSLWDVLSGRKLVSIQERELSRACVSPDGDWIVTTSPADGDERRDVVKTWDARGERVWTVGDPSVDFDRDVAISGDSRTLAVVDAIDRVHLFKLRTGDPIRTIQTRSGSASTTFHVDAGRGSILAVSGDSVATLDIESGTTTRVDFAEDGDAERKLSVVSGDGNRAFVAGRDAIRVIGSQDGAPIALLGAGGWKGVRFLGDERFILTIGEGGATVWDTRDNRIVRHFPVHEKVDGAVDCDDGFVVLRVGSDYRRTRNWIWNYETGMHARLAFCDDDSYPRVVARDEAGRRLLISSSAGEGRSRWTWMDEATGRAVGEPRELSWSAQVMPDRTHYLIDVAEKDRPADVELRRIMGDAVVRRFESPGCPVDVRICADGRRAVGIPKSGSDATDSVAIVWDVESGAIVAKQGALPLATFKSWYVVGDGSRLLVELGEADARTASLFDLSSGRVIADLGPCSETPVISADGTRVAIVSGDYGKQAAGFWDTGDGRRLSAYDPPDANLDCSFDRTGRWLAVFGRKQEDVGVVALHDAGTGQLVREIECGDADFWKCNFSSDGRRIVAANYHGTTDVWDLTTGERRWSVFNAPDVSQFGSSVATSHDGHTFATATPARSRSHASDVTIWNVDTGYSSQPIQIGDIEYSRIRFNHDGSLLIVDGNRIVTQAPADESARKEFEATSRITMLYDVATGKRIWDYRRGDDRWKRAAHFHPDGRRVLVGNWRLIDPVSGNVTSRSQDDIDSIRPRFSLDGRWIITAGGRQATLFHARSGRLVTSFVGHERTVMMAAVSPDGGRVATASKDRTAIVWEAATGRRMHTLTGHRGGVNDVVFSPDGTRIATASSDSTVIVWDAATGRRLTSSEPVKDDYATDVAFRPRGSSILVGFGTGRVRLLDASTGRMLQQFDGHTKEVTALDIHRDGKHGLTASDDGQLIVWDLDSGKMVRKLLANGASVTSAFYNRNGDAVVAQILRGDVVAINPLTGASKRIRDNGKFSPIMLDNSIALSPDGRYLLRPCDNGFQLQDLKHDDIVYKLGTSSSSGYAISPDGFFVAGASDDNHVIVQEAGTGRLIRIWASPSPGTVPLEFTSDGRRLFTVSADSSIRLWDIASGEELVQVISVAKAGFLAVTPEGLFDGPQAIREQIVFRVPGGNQTVPVDRFFQDFYVPGLLDTIWRGGRPRPAGGFGEKIAPLVAIISPERQSTTRERHVEVVAEIVDQGGGIKGPWLMHNGSRVTADGRTERKDRTLRSTFVVPLVAGENRIDVRAASADGSWESEPAVLSVRHDREQDPPELHLVAVGVNRYRQQAMSLEFAKPDAEAMIELFANRAPALYGGHKIHISPLFDEAATKHGIRDKLATVARVADPQDTIVVYLAGHGMTLGQRYFFIPHDFEHKADLIDDDIRAQGLSGDEIGDLLAGIPALKRVLILDTCQSGGALPKLATGRDGFAFRRALERLSHAQGVFTVAATAATDEAVESRQLKHGVLTYALLAGAGAAVDGPLAGQSAPAETEGKHIEIRDWFAFAQEKVPLITKLYFGKEQFVGFSGQGTSFPILPIGVPETQPDVGR